MIFSCKNLELAICMYRQRFILSTHWSPFFPFLQLSYNFQDNTFFRSLQHGVLNLNYRKKGRRKRWFWWGCWGLWNFQRASEYLSPRSVRFSGTWGCKIINSDTPDSISLWGWWWWTTTCYWSPFSCNWSGCYSGKRSRRTKLSSSPIADFWSQVSEHLSLDVLCIFSCPCLWTKQRWNCKQKRCNLVFFLLVDWLLAMVSYWSDFHKVLICCMLPLDPLFVGLQICYSHSCMEEGVGGGIDLAASCKWCKHSYSWLGHVEHREPLSTGELQIYPARSPS